MSDRPPGLSQSEGLHDFRFTTATVWTSDELAPTFEIRCEASGREEREGCHQMSTTVQLIVVALIVALAAAYVLCATWKTWFSASKPGCGSGCGKCAAPTPEPQPVANGRRPLPMA